MVLAAAALRDWKTQEIPDRYPLILVSLAVLSWAAMPGVSVPDRLLGAGCVSIPMLMLTVAVPGAFGGADIKLTAAGGLFLGWKLVATAMIIALFLGGIYGLYLLGVKKAGRKKCFAFGPFLCAGMVVSQIAGNSMIDWYLKVIA